MFNKPKIVTLDLEVSPHEGYYWGKKWETDIVSPKGFGKILCFGAKWLKEKVFVKGLIDYRNDQEVRLIRELRELLDEADIVIGQNLKDFDLKWCNTMFLKFGLSPPSPYKVVDTKTEAKKYLKLPSYSLDDMVNYFSLGRKKSTKGFEMWEGCLNGNKSDWRTMKTYCAHDVVLTEKLYLKLLPLISHPNLGMFYGKVVCPRCGSKHFQSRGYDRTSSGTYKRLQCQSCNGWTRSPEKIEKLKLNKPI